MSSLTLRAPFEAALPTLLPSLRFVRTENTDLPRNPPLVLPDVWMTLLYAIEERRHATMGRNPWIVETGTVTVVLCAKSGHGAEPALLAGKEVVTAVEGWMSPDGAAWFNRVSAPRALDPEADGEWMLYGVTCSYEAQERPVLP